MPEYQSKYPPTHDHAHVWATSYYASNAPLANVPYLTTDPERELTGSMDWDQWLSALADYLPQRFHIDLGSAKLIRRIYYENSHDSGGGSTTGVQNFTFWGSNEATAFAELTYAVDTNWTQLTTAQATFDQHAAADAADPKYILVTNINAYRYYAFKFADSWGASRMGVRRIELQQELGGYMQSKKGWDAYLMASIFQKEAAFAGGKTHTSNTSCSFKGFEFDPGYADTVTSDKDEITGKEHGYDQEITAYGNNPTVKFARVRPNDLAAFASLVLGITTPTKDGDFTAYRHLIYPIENGSALPSISVVHKIGAIQTEFKGVKGNTLKLSGSAGGFLAMDVGMIASGSRATNAASFANAITESWMKIDQLKVFLETGANIQIAATPTQGTEDISSAIPDPLSIRFKSFDFGWDNKAEPQPGAGGAGVLQDVIYGRRAATLKITMQFEDAAEIAYFTAQDACALEFDFKAAGLIAAGGAMYYGASLVIPRAKIKAYPAPKGGVNDSLSQEFDFEIFENGVNPAVIMYVYTAQAAYLATP